MSIATRSSAHHLAGERRLATGRRLATAPLLDAARLLANALLLATTLLPAGPTAAQSKPGADLRPNAVAAVAPYATRAQVQDFIDRMVQTHGMDFASLLRLFSQLRPSERVIHLITPTTGGTYRRSWREYRQRFIEPVRINGGLEFWQSHGADLKLASALYGVPEEIIVAIIGVETIYGRNTGSFKVVEALSTLAFDYPPRADYFRSELEQFLLYARENGIDPLEPLGSYAGAIGTPQFMPGSIRRFAVDLDKDGRIDLRNSPADAIGSVASFLNRHGWVEGKATHYPVEIEDLARAQPFIAAGPVPKFDILTLAQAGITSSEEISPDEQLVLADLVNVNAPADHVLGTWNFYAITRYNRSYLYAMAVIDLADVLRQRKAAEVPAPQ